MPVTLENIRPMALSMDSVGLRGSLQHLFVANYQKRSGADSIAAAPPEEQNDPGWGEAAIAPSHLHIASSYRSNLHAVPIGCLFKIAQF
jgi:hypothetical protein